MGTMRLHSQSYYRDYLRSCFFYYCETCLSEYLVYNKYSTIYDVAYIYYDIACILLSFKNSPYADS